MPDIVLDQGLVRDEARQAWGKQLLAVIDEAGKEAERLRLFGSPEAIHVALIQTAIINLMTCCDWPADRPLVQSLVQSAFEQAERNMQSVRRLQ